MGGGRDRNRLADLSDLHIAGCRLCGLSACPGLVAQNGVGHHGRIEVGADFHDHVAVETAYQQ
jgi:hypothetical protein